MLSFTLSMPSNTAWDGKWSGEGKLYAVVRSMGQSKKAKEAAKAVLEKGYFTHRFSDGWVAGVEVKEVSAAEARKIRKRSNGFMGYEWMVDSIIAHGEIRASS